MWPPEARPPSWGSRGRRPGSSGPRPTRCCSRGALAAPAEEGAARRCLLRPPAPPMCASLGPGPVAALPAVAPPSPRGCWRSGGRRDCVPREGKRPGGARASGGGAGVWQVSGLRPAPRAPRAPPALPASRRRAAASPASCFLRPGGSPTARPVGSQRGSWSAGPASSSHLDGCGSSARGLGSRVSGRGRAFCRWRSGAGKCC